MKGRLLAWVHPGYVSQSLAEGCNRVLSPALSTVCLSHLPLSIWPNTVGAVSRYHWSYPPHKLPMVGQRGAMSKPSAIRRENGRLIALRTLFVAENQGVIRPQVNPTKKREKKRYSFNKCRGTGRQTWALTLIATVHGIISKAGERGEQHLERVTELFKFSLVLIVDQPPAWKCPRKIGKILSGVPIITRNA